MPAISPLVAHLLPCFGGQFMHFVRDGVNQPLLDGHSILCINIVYLPTILHAKELVHNMNRQ